MRLAGATTHKRQYGWTLVGVHRHSKGSTNVGPIGPTLVQLTKAANPNVGLIGLSVSSTFLTAGSSGLTKAYEHPW